MCLGKNFIFGGSQTKLFFFSFLALKFCWNFVRKGRWNSSQCFAEDKWLSFKSEEGRRREGGRGGGGRGGGGIKNILSISAERDWLIRSGPLLRTCLTDFLELQISQLSTELITYFRSTNSSASCIIPFHESLKKAWLSMPAAWTCHIK